LDITQELNPNAVQFKSRKCVLSREDIRFAGVTRHSTHGSAARCPIGIAMPVFIPREACWAYHDNGPSSYD